MKGLILSFLFFSTSSLWAGEFTGAGASVNAVLKQYQMSLQSLKAQGHKVLIGEVTGAGKFVSLDKVKYLVTKKRVHDLHFSTHVEFVYPSAAKTLGEVEFFEFNRKVVRPSQIKALILDKK